MPGGDVVSTEHIRNGKGHRRYRRSRTFLRNRTARENVPCAWCGRPIDTTLPASDPMSFTADHKNAIANGGHLNGPLQPMHRRCNAQKGSSFEVKIRPAS